MIASESSCVGLQRDMTSDSFIEVVQDAVDRTGMDQIPITDRTKLLSDNGPGYVSRAFRDYLGMVGIRHILAAPFHPQTCQGRRQIGPLGLSLFRINVRLSGRQKCHSVMLPWYQMKTS